MNISASPFPPFLSAGSYLLIYHNWITPQRPEVLIASAQKFQPCNCVCVCVCLRTCVDAKSPHVCASFSVHLCALAADV